MKFSIIGLVLISAVRYVWLWILLKKYARFFLSKDFLKEHISLAIPLIASSLLGASAQYVDGFLVLNKFDTSTFAIFRYGAKEFPLVVLMANAMSTALIPEFSSKEKMKDSLKMLRTKSARLAHFLFPITILLILLSEWLYPRIFNPDFADSAAILNIYLLLIISRLIFPHTLLIGLKKTKVVMYASMAELLINIVLSVIFIQYWGIEGVAFATLIAYGVQKIIWVIYNKTVLNIAVREYIPISIWAIYSLLTLLAFVVVY
ncbi:polysaccharide biosynthesis C-terminal domain-containing protein [Draconibacterium orientale]|uniref:oligosaccharide flippase family protein n=1 Tax=Draconibacterium orientale TaxID=1168034 RepID=UPI0029C099BD|nr:polysaccharide biosynthesis C-terminal domain-containing protein [Draconibacterium orientale]